MKYLSTRGGVTDLSFCQAVSMGLSSDGGLIVPEYIPNIGVKLKDFSKLSYPALAFEIMTPFVDDISSGDLRSIINKSYSSFSEKQVAPLVQVADYYVMELFHGPTLAFKDVALQFLGNIFEYINRDKDQALNVLGATSGDTGSAAIAGLKGKKNINLFIMFPEGRTSSIQERQMTTVTESNVQNIAIEGTFDDCQALLKTVFRDLAFKSELNLGAVNSVNWARVLAQTVYYFSAYFQLGMPSYFQVSVPTGNFGNIFAAFVARQMGLPIERLILATNQNDILHRFFETGLYKKTGVRSTNSPAMDIQVASNFERYLYYFFGQEREKFEKFVESFETTGSAEINLDTYNFHEVFSTGSASDAQISDRIRSIYNATGYIADPHTAVGIEVGIKKMNTEIPLVCLATAHPAKFPSLISEILPNSSIEHPTIEALKGLPTRKKKIGNNVDELKDFIRSFVAD